MKELMKNFRTSALAISIVYVLLGVVLLVWPNMALNVLGYVVAGVLLVAGAIYIINHFRKDYWTTYPNNDFAVGLILVVVALLIFLKVGLLTNLLPFFLGIAVIGGGVTKLQNAIDMRRIGYKGWIYILICSLLSIVLGVLVLFYMENVMSTLMVLIGIGLIFSGLSDIYTMWCVGARVKEHKRAEQIQE